MLRFKREIEKLYASQSFHQARRKTSKKRVRLAGLQREKKMLTSPQADEKFALRGELLFRLSADQSWRGSS
jgi:hypothetical protein